MLPPIRLIHGDCHAVLPELIREGIIVDTVIADIPYNLHRAAWDSGFSLAPLSPTLHQLLKPGGNLVIFSGWSGVIETRQALDPLFTLRNWIVYDRVKGRGAKKNLVSTREDILWYSRGEKEPYTFNRVMSNIPKKTSGFGKKNGEANRALSNVWSDISPIVPWSKEKVPHPTQKPVQLMERCVSLWTNEGDTVLDFTMGSGSTGAACLRLRRGFIGIEIDEKYFHIAEGRLIHT